MGSQHYRPGERVRVKRGAMVRDYSSRDPTRRPSKRAQVVTVDHVLRYDDGEGVAWAGGGGYWREAHVRDVERV